MKRLYETYRNGSSGNCRKNTGALFMVGRVTGITSGVVMKKAAFILAALGAMALATSAGAQSCPYDSRCLNNPYGAGSPYNPNSPNNPYGAVGSPYSNESAKNPYATNAPKIYDQSGNYRGKLSSNQYDPDSVSNPNGRYGSQYSPDSVNNKYGAGNPYAGNTFTVVPQTPAPSAPMVFQPFSY